MSAQVLNGTINFEGAVERLTAICKNLESTPVVFIDAIYEAYPETLLPGVVFYRDLNTILDALISITRERDAIRDGLERIARLQNRVGLGPARAIAEKTLAALVNGEVEE